MVAWWQGWDGGNGTESSSSADLKGDEWGCSHLAKATTSLLPNTSWLVPKHLQVLIDMSHLPWSSWGSRFGCFKGNPYLLEPEGGMMWTNWDSIGHFRVLNMDPWGWGSAEALAGLV